MRFELGDRKWNAVTGIRDQRFSSEGELAEMVKKVNRNALRWISL